MIVTQSPGYARKLASPHTSCPREGNVHEIVAQLRPPDFLAGAGVESENGARNADKDE